MAEMILDYLGYVSIALMVVLAVANILVIADKMAHRSGYLERAIKHAQFFIAMLRFGGGGGRDFRGRHYEG